MSTRQWPLAVSSVFVSSAFTSQRLLSLSILLDELRLRTLSEPITQIRCRARKEMVVEGVWKCGPGTFRGAKRFPDPSCMCSV